MIRKFLFNLLVVISVVGMMVFGWPLLASLWFDDKPVTQVDISELARGNYIEADGPDYRAFILKTEDGELRIFSIPYSENTYWLPDLSWDKAYLPCKNFGLEVEGSRIDADALFKCLEQEGGAWWKTRLRWDIEGTSTGEIFEDLVVPEYEQRGDIIFLG